MLALAIEAIEAQSAKERQGARTDIVANLPPSSVTAFGKAREKSAAAVGTSPRQVQKAKERQIRKPADSVPANLREQKGEASEKAAAKAKDKTE